MKINGNLRFSTLGTAELQNAVIERLNGLPSTSVAGRIVYNTVDGNYCYYNGTSGSWIVIANAADVTALGVELNAFEVAIGAFINANGTFNPSAFNGFNHVSGLSSSSTLLDVLSQLDSAIISVTPSLASLSDTNIPSPVNGQILFFDSASSFWKNNTLSSLADGDLLRWNASTNNWDNIPSASFGASSFGTVIGDSGTAVADSPADVISILGPSGSGILTAATDNPESLTIRLDAGKLTVMTDPIVLGDDLIIRDASTATTLRSSLTKIVQDLNIPNGISTNGFVTRVGGGTYASRSIVVAGAGALAGLAITDGDAVSANPSLGLDIANTAPLVGSVASTDSLVMLDTSSSSNVRVTVAQLTAGIGAPALDQLSDVTITTPVAGESLVYDGSIWANRKTQHIYDSTLNGGPASTHTITHDLGQQFVNVAVYSDTMEQIIPDTVSLTSSTVTTVTFNSPIDCFVVISGVPGVVAV